MTVTAPAKPDSDAGNTNLHARDAKKMGVVEALGLKERRLLSPKNIELQFELDAWRDEFLEMLTFYDERRVRHDYRRHGMLAEIVANTPIRIFDLPELKMVCNTAFVDTSGRMYISDVFFKRLQAEQKAGLDSLFFLIRHEAEHLRRIHMQRMLQYPHDLANVAQDIRINIDIIKVAVADRLAGRDAPPAPSDPEFIEDVKRYYKEHEGASISIGQAMQSYEAGYAKWDGKSEEAIAAELFKQPQQERPQEDEDREVSLKDIMEGAAQDLDAIIKIHKSGAIPQAVAKNVSGQEPTPQELADLAKDLRLIGTTGADPAKVTEQQMIDVYLRLGEVLGANGLMQRDLDHQRMQVPGAQPAPSATTGDSYINTLNPIRRVGLAQAALKSILMPSNGAPSNQKGGMKLKDIKRKMKPGQGKPQPGQAGEAGAKPDANVYHGDEHAMDAKDVADILYGADVSRDSIGKLGYDDLQSISNEEKMAKDSAVNAINKASEDQMRLGSRYPGGHLVDYAKAQMIDFYKPILTWTFVVKKLLDGLGKGQKYDLMEPWQISYVDPSDMGFHSDRDVPYNGSLVPGKPQKPLVFALVDTSGSVDDAMLKRFVTEAINAARSSGKNSGSDVVIVFADTIARGAPVFITEKNYREFLRKGINYGGRGGTDLQSAIMNVFDMVKRGSKSGYAGRKVDAMLYFTDTFDVTPRRADLMAHAAKCGLAKLPTTVFIAPKQCFQQGFKDGVKDFAQVIYYDSKVATKVSMQEIERTLGDQTVTAAATAGAKKPRGMRP